MTFVIGRVSIADPASAVSLDGDVLDVEFTVTKATTAGSAVAGKMLRLQLLGLVGNDDEEVVPVTSTDDPSLDGYYRVLNVSTDPFPVFLSSGAMRVSIGLERVANGWALPVLELVSSAAVRTNVVGVIDGEPEGVIAWRPADAAAFQMTGNEVVRDAASSNGVAIYTLEAPWSATTQQVFVDPSEFYTAGCLIEVQGSDNVWYPVIGRQAPQSMAGKWRISNGLIRITASATTIGDIKVEIYLATGSQWVSMATELVYGFDASGAAGTFIDDTFELGGFGCGFDGADMVWVEPHIIRNDRDTLVLGWRRAFGAYQTFTIHAGDYFAEFYTYRPDLTSFSTYRHAIAARSTWGSSVLSTTAPFSASPGVQSSGNDANGNRLALIHTDTAHARYTSAASGIYQTSVVSGAAFGIGVIYQGSSASANNTGLALAEQYTVAKAWRTFAVAQ